MSFKNLLTSDFTLPEFKTAFKRYFAELQISVTKWDELFAEMNNEGRNFAYLRLDESNRVVGFIQFTEIAFSSWFFETKMGFIREFWIDPAYRSAGHGSELLRCAEEYFADKGIYKIILTTDTAERFYLCRGYQRDPDISAKNKDDVFIKNLR